MDQKSVKEIIRDQMEVKSVSLEKLLEATEVPRQFLEAILEGDNSNLPPAPYVRGYFMKVAAALDLDSTALWQAYKKQSDFRTSGIYDKLPQNRFAFKKSNKGKAIGMIIGLIVLVWLLSRIGQFWGVPPLEIYSPLNEVLVSEPSVEISARIDESDKLTINNEIVAVDDEGFFNKKFDLQPGINTFEFKVKRFLGKETIMTRTVIYQQ